VDWFSPLSLQQRQRRDALREARRLLRRGGGVRDSVDSEEILRVAEFILGRSSSLLPPTDFDG
jgi:hypothetical protein